MENRQQGLVVPVAGRISCAISMPIPAHLTCPKYLGGLNNCNGEKLQGPYENGDSTPTAELPTHINQQQLAQIEGLRIEERSAAPRQRRMPLDPSYCSSDLIPKATKAAVRRRRRQQLKEDGSWNISRMPAWQRARRKAQKFDPEQARKELAAKGLNRKPVGPESNDDDKTDDDDPMYRNMSPYDIRRRTFWARAERENGIDRHEYKATVVGSYPNPTYRPAAPAQGPSDVDQQIPFDGPQPHGGAKASVEDETLAAPRWVHDGQQ